MAAIAAGVLLVALVIGVWVMIGLLKDSRDHIRAQDTKTAVLLEKLRAAAPTTRQLIGETRPVIRTLHGVLGPLSRSTGAVAAATEQLPNTLNAADALTANALPLLDKLAPVDLTHLLDSTGSLVDATLYRGRLTNALDAANGLLADIREQHLVAVSANAARTTPTLMRALLRVQLRTLQVQQRSLDAQLTTLAVQRQALTHIESIDRKTGGPVGPPVP